MEKQKLEKDSAQLDEQDLENVAAGMVIDPEVLERPSVGAIVEAEATQPAMVKIILTES